MVEINLDDAPALAQLDSQQVLRGLATAGAQVRTGLAAVGDSDLTGVTGGSVRAVVVLGSGHSRHPGDLLAALTEPSSPTPVVSRCGPLPAWGGAMDLVVAVSARGDDPRTLAAAGEAARRGAAIVAIAPGESELARQVRDARGTVLATTTPDLPVAACLWSQLTPLLCLAEQAGLLRFGAGALTAVADRLDERAIEYGPVAEAVDNDAKSLAFALQGALPWIVAVSAVGTAVATRFAQQITAQAKLPALCESLTQAMACGIGMLRGRLAVPGDPFHDPFEDPDPTPRLQLLVIPGPNDAQTAGEQADTLLAMATAKGLSTRVFPAVEDDPLLALADHLALADFAATYLALGEGTDPACDVV